MATVSQVWAFWAPPWRKTSSGSSVPQTSADSFLSSSTATASRRTVGGPSYGRPNSSAFSWNRPNSSYSTRFTGSVTSPDPSVGFVPHPLDEYPIHQAPLSMRYVTSSDRNFYDRCYFNAHDRTGDIFLVTGLGVYPNLGVTAAYVTVKRGGRQWTVRCSDALGDRLQQRVGPYRIDVLEPLERIRIVCDAAEHGIAMNLEWQGSFPAVDEPRHLVYARDR